MPCFTLFPTSLSPLVFVNKTIPNLMISTGRERECWTKCRLHNEIITISLFLSRIVSSHCAWLFFMSSSFFCTLLKLSSNTCCGFRPVKKEMILHEAVKEKKHTRKNKMKQTEQMKKQEKMHKFLWLLLPYDFELFAHPLTLCVINYGLIFLLHFS